MQLLIATGVPVLLYILVPRLIGKQDAPKTLLSAACLTFFAAGWLPSPLIAGQQTSWVTHIVGGGIFGGLLWLYIARAYDWLPKPAYIEIGSLYALVCALGVANELFEAVTYSLFGWPKTIADTSWDLVANIVGTLIFYFVYRLVRLRR